MKKFLKTFFAIILAIIIVVAAALAVFVYKNPDLSKSAFEILKSAPGNNLKAAWIFLTDSSSISEQIEKNTETFDNAVSNVVGTENTLSPAVKEAIESGKYTEEEITRILLSGESAIAEIESEKQAAPSETEDEVVVTEPDENQPEVVPVPDEPVEDVPDTVEKVPDTPVVSDPPVKQPEVTTPVQKPEQQIPEKESEPDDNTVKPVTAADTAAYVAKLYVQKSKFMDYLGSIEKLIINEYNALPEDMKIPSERKRIALAHLQTMAQMEKECDAEVEKILEELKSKLISENKDTSVVANLQKSYENEKSLKKAQYMDVFLNGLPKKNKTENTEK